MFKSICFTMLVYFALLSAPAQASNLGLSLDDLLTRLQASAKSDGVSLSIEKLFCGENPMPGDATKKIMSCSHTLGDGKMIITNTDPAGPLIDINTQRWSKDEAPKMVSWIAGAINNDDAAGHVEAAAKMITEAKASNIGAGTLGKGEFSVLSMGEDFVISVSLP